MFKTFHLVQQVSETSPYARSHLVKIKTVAFEDQTHLLPVLRTQNSEYLFAALIHHSILQRTTDTTCGPRATCGNH